MTKWTDEEYEAMLQPGVLPFSLDTVDYTGIFDFEATSSGLLIATVGNRDGDGQIAGLLGEYSYQTIRALQRAGRVKFNESNGLVVADWDGDLKELSQDPSKLFRLAVGWGPKFLHFVNNACGKVLAAAALGMDSLRLEETNPGAFFEGTYPYGGAASANGVLSGLSSLTQYEDHDQATANSGLVSVLRYRVQSFAPAA